MKAIIYSYRNIQNERHYIGQTINESQRAATHLRNAFKYNHQQYFYKALRKYGLDSFEYSVLEIIESNTKEELELKVNVAEMKWIALYDSYNNGYNMNTGGGSSYGYKHTEETKKYISEVVKGRVLSEETKNKISERVKGFTHTEESKLKISNSLKGCKNYLYGMKREQWVLDKTSKTRVEKYGKKVYQYNNNLLIKTFNSIREAAKSIGVDRSAVSRAISKKTKCKGFTFTTKP